MIALEHIYKTYEGKNGSVNAVEDVSITINDGEIYGIIGFSGAGKSTLVRCINLLERPTSGKVEVNGVDMLSLAEEQLRGQRKSIGMIFQQFNLMPSRTVFQNVALPIMNSGLSREEIHAKVSKLLEYVELSDRSEAYPSQLSGGQKQRVAIARALATDPDILLCDEATSALDPQTTKSILNLIARLNRELGITVVVITHEMQVIKRICHRVAVMEHGRVVEENTVYDVFSNPQQQITKDFIRTTSNLSEIYSLVEIDSPLVRLESNQVLFKMQYQQAKVSEPLISIVSKKYDVTLNVLFSDVELLDEYPLGGTVAILTGDKEQQELAMDYIRSRDVRIEVIKHGAA